MTDPSVSGDPLLSELGELPQHDVEPAVAQRIRAAALSHFDPVVTAPGPWARFFEPAFVVAGMLSYLTWTAQTLSSLHEVSHENSVITARTR
jgi:hypothetical protein